MNSEYWELSTAQKRELSEWHDKNPEQKKKKKPHHEKGKVKAHDVSAAVTRALADMMKPKQETDPTNAVVLSLLKAAISNTDATKQNGEVASVTNSSTETKHPPITLKSILKQAKNGSSLRGPAMHETMKRKRVVCALQPDKPFDRGKKLRSNHLYHKIVASMEVNMEMDGQETWRESI